MRQLISTALITGIFWILTKGSKNIVDILEKGAVEQAWIAASLTILLTIGTVVFYRQEKVTYLYIVVGVILGISVALIF
jgi:hypothetical protein